MTRVLSLTRFASDGDSTAGLMTLDGTFLAFTLEDEHRVEKVKGETRIPAGTYRLRFRKVGGFHNKYKARFGEPFHKGMIELVDVPNFKYILIHCGNTDEDTAGCLLVGSGINGPPGSVDGHYAIVHSARAYRYVYPKIAAALERGEDVSITIEDGDQKT